LPELGQIPAPERALTPIVQAQPRAVTPPKGPTASDPKPEAGELSKEEIKRRIRDLLQDTN
jgi:hypothetical protein